MHCYNKTRDVSADVVIDVYVKSKNIDLLTNSPNIFYHGVVEYSKMIKAYKNSDMLLHVDGFSDYSIIDNRNAFSTKISDCYLLGIPFFIYSPLDIASTKYAYSMNKDYTAISKDELKDKLNNIINNQLLHVVDYEKIVKDFSV